ncbi:MAG: DUF1499 domain-containing protein [Methyloprofundus sp.]|uniref:DUF1499 domain-containing protein n=1 Tax=Methyloprofundus sp. TaxID=2020875 RepID=UPI00261E1697|nr:DUF1499 domain-containing protein [Methyloprofundus sp.]
MKAWYTKYNKHMHGLLFLALFSTQVVFSAEFNDSLQEGKLPLCPTSPNCISSEQGMITAIDFSKMEGQQAWLKLQKTIITQGGQIKNLQSDYLHAVFTTPLLEFVDDVQARLDLKSRQIHLRSASRTGYYDFGANRARLKKIKQAMHIALHPEALKNVYH